MASLATTTTTATPKQDTRYTVTDQELQWVHDIKAAVQENESQYFRKHQKAPFDQPRMTPLMWVQLAIVAKGKPKKAVLRLNKMRHLWELYDFNSKTLAQALDWQERVLPGFLAPAANDLGNHAVLTMDYSKFLPDKIQDQHDWNMMMYLFIVLMEALSTDLDEIRTGSVWVCQCEQFGWKVSAMFFVAVQCFFIASRALSRALYRAL